MIPYLVNLRVFSMFGGMLAHCLLFLVPASFYPWLVKNFTPAPWASVLVLYIYWIQTPVFFSLAGYFGKYLHKKLGTWKFLQERFARIGLPFLFGMLLPIPIYLIYAIGLYSNDNAMLVKFFLNRVIFTGIFWFLYYLLLFYLMMALGLSAILDYLAKKMTRLLVKSSSFVLFLLILLPSSFLFIIMLVAQVAVIMPSLSLIPHWDLLYYFLFFCCGWIGYKNSVVLRLVTANNCWLLFFATAIIFPVLSFLALKVWPYHQILWLRIVINILEAVNAIFMLLGVYSVFFRYLNRCHSWFVFSGKASYWCYYMQYPVIVAIQSYLLPISLPPSLKVLYVFIGTMGILLLSYGVWRAMGRIILIQKRKGVLSYPLLERN